jgi:cell division inhibitor SepF
MRTAAAPEENGARARNSLPMALRDSWRKALALSGLVDDSQPTNTDYLLRASPDPSDPSLLPESAAGAPAPTAPQPSSPLPTPQAPAWPAGTAGATADPTADYRYDDAGQIVVRRIGIPADAAPAPGRDEIVEVFGGVELPPPSAPAAPPPPPYVPSPPAPPRDVAVQRITPRSFNDAQAVADRYKSGTPVILDLQGVETDLAKRLIGFASGLTYGLEGGMERLDDRVFLLTPRGVEIPTGQRARLAAQGSLNRA